MCLPKQNIFFSQGKYVSIHLYITIASTFEMNGWRLLTSIHCRTRRHNSTNWWGSPEVFTKSLALVKYADKYWCISLSLLKTVNNYVKTFIYLSLLIVNKWIPQTSISRPGYFPLPYFYHNFASDVSSCHQW